MRIPQITAIVALLIPVAGHGCDFVDESLAAGDAVPLADANQDASLVALAVSIRTLAPVFNPGVTSYAIDLPLGAQSISVTPTAAVPGGVTITVDGMPVASGAASPAIALNLGPNAIDVVVTADGGAMRTYAITAARGPGILQQAYIKASNTDAGDFFGGITLALDGDTLAVGARHEDSMARGVGGDQANEGATNAGAVYVFVRSGTAWSQQAYIKASNTGGDAFGSHLALFGDTLAVGARLENSAAPGINGDQNSEAAGDSGAVYVFVRTGTTWSQQAYIKASNPGPEDFFGNLALSGDTLAVAASREDSAATGINGDETNDMATNSGAVYVFVRSNAIWSQQAYIKASNTAASDIFGSRVALDGETLAVAARQEDSAATGVGGDQTDNTAMDSGAVYVFVRSGGEWSQQAYIKASNTGASDRFGHVALSGDTLVVGVQLEDSAATGVGGNQNDNSAMDSGAVYVFVRSGGEWSQQAYIKASNTDPRDEFGARLTLSGDILAVGAQLEDSAATGIDGDQTGNSATDSGAVYVFVRSDATWSQQAYVKASNTAPGDEFGGAVALFGGILAIGADLEDSAATGINGDESSEGAVDSGAVYVFQ